MNPAVSRVVRYPLQVFGACVGIAARLIPRRHRYGTAKAAARAVAPLLRFTDAWRFRSVAALETPAELALQMFLRTLDRVGTPYDPVIHMKGAETLHAVRGTAGGVLILGIHAALSTLLVRYLFEEGYSPVIVVSDEMRFGGAARRPEQIPRSPSFLLRVRTQLRSGAIVGAMADHPSASSRTMPVVTGSGDVFLSDGLIRVARKCGSAFLFIGSYQRSDGDIQLELAAPSPTSGTVEEIAADFAAFVQRHAQRVREVTSGTWPEPECDAHCPISNCAR